MRNKLRLLREIFWRETSIERASRRNWQCNGSRCPIWARSAMITREKAAAEALTVAHPYALPTTSIAVVDRSRRPELASRTKGLSTTARS